jgi:transcriptional regulator with XRE-family HTH domain
VSAAADQQTQALLARVGSRIRVARKALGMTQAELAAEIGVVRSSVANMEQGRQGLTLMRLGQLATALRMSLDDLIVPAELPSASVPQEHKARVIRAWVAGCSTCGADLGWDVHRTAALQMANAHIAETLDLGAAS